MTITSTDLVFFGSEYPLDVPYGGGKMSSLVIQDGVVNNVFDNVSDADRAAGRVQLRKGFLAVVSENADRLLGVQLSMLAGPTDAGTECVIFGDAPTRAVAAAGIAKFPYQGGPGPIGGTLTPVLGEPFKQYLAGTPPEVGDRVLLYKDPAVGFPAYTPDLLKFAPKVVDVIGSSSPYTLEFDQNVTGLAIDKLRSAGPSTLATRCYGASKFSGSATAGVSTVHVLKAEAQLVPDMGSTYPTLVNLLDPTELRMTKGKVPIFRAGDAAVITEGPTSELVTIASVSYGGAIELVSPTVNTYTSDAVLSSLMPFGDMGCSVGSSFSQQTWTRVFADTLIGSPISANYNRSSGSITIDNLGGATERWAIVFTSSTAFKLIGESFGEIATGDTSTDFLPTNPITGAPYFTITAAGWGSGWSIGNVLRFNTVGARAGFWMARTISPSAAGGDDTLFIEMRGST